MYRVLIAEDELLERVGLRYGIHWEKYDMTVTADVANGAEAWNEYQRNRPDVLVTDLKMPVMDGMTLIDRIRQTDRRTRIVIVSCLEDFAIAREAISLGVSGYILKASMDMGEIERVIGQIRDELEKEGETRPLAETDKEELSLHAWMDGEMNLPETANRLAEQMNAGTDPAIQMCAVLLMTRDGMRPKTDFLMRADYIISDIIREEPAAQKLGASEGCVFWSVHGQTAETQAISTGLMEQVRDAMLNYLNMETVFAVSGEGNAEDAAELAKSALFRLQNTFFSEQDQTTDEDPDFQALTAGLCADVMKIVKGQRAAHTVELIQNTLKAGKNIYDSGDCVRSLACNIAAIVGVQDVRSEQSAQLEKECRTAIMKCMRISAVSSVLCKYLREMTERRCIRPQTEGVSAALRYMDSHLCEGPSLNEVAERAGLSPSYFSTCFRREMGMGFNEYLTHMRMERACMLLRSTDRSVTELAAELGYYDPSHFIRVFKKTVGVSPRQYRVANGREENE